MELSGLKYLVVGAGLWGATLAERIAGILGDRVLVVDRREHIGGNCYDYEDGETGIFCHEYGTHVFHTRIRRVWDYVNCFATFTSYRHRVFTLYKGHIYPMPINLSTINSFYNLNLRPFEVNAFLAGEARKVSERVRNNLEEKALSLVGRPLYEAFIKGYTRKQWGKEPEELPAAIITRLPVRTNYHADYFDDPWQGMPQGGYTAMIAAMLAHPNIEVRSGVSYRDIAERIPENCRIFYSGAPDEFFDYALGALEWRTLRFERKVVDYADYQGCPVLNQADNEVPYTRVHEFKHLYPERGQQGERSFLMYEYPKPFVHGDAPFYPVETVANKALLSEYMQKKAPFPRIIFGGRLGSYRYMDMDMTIEGALSTFDDLRNKFVSGARAS